MNNIKDYNELWQDHVPVKYKDYITNKFNDIHNQLFNYALNNFLDDVINNTYKFDDFNKLYSAFVQNGEEFTKDNIIKYIKFIEIKNVQYWKPSSIIVRISYFNIKTSKKYKLDNYWNNFQNKDNKPTIYDITVLKEKISDPEIISFDYVNGTAKIESRLNDIIYNVDLDLIKKEDKYSNDFIL